MWIKGHNLDDELIVEIGKFSILWNCFERFQFDNNCNAEKIRFVCSRICIDKDKQAELAKVLNERRSWFGQTIPEYVETGLYPGNAHQSQEEDRLLMEKFMEQKEDDLRFLHTKFGDPVDSLVEGHRHNAGHQAHGAGISKPLQQIQRHIPIATQPFDQQIHLSSPPSVSRFFDYSILSFVCIRFSKKARARKFRARAFFLMLFSP